MRERIETENVIFGIVVALAVCITFVMGWLVYSTPRTNPETTLRILSPSVPESLGIQRRLNTEFRKIHPEIDIEIISFPWQSLYRKLEFMIVAGIPPDLTGIEQPILPKFIYLGVVEPLDDWIRNDPGFDASTLFAKCMDEGSWDGIQYAIPNVVSPVCLWYNKTLFDREGLAYPNKEWTFVDLVENSRTLTKDLDGDGILDQYGFYTNNNHWNRYPCWVWMMGGEFMSPDQKKCLFDTPQTMHAIQWLANLALKERVMPSWTFLSTIGSPTLFLGGRLAMTTETRYFLQSFFLERYKEQIKPFDWDVCELPHDKGRATTFICGLNIIPKTISRERKKMAWEYMKFLSSETGQEVYGQMNTALPCRIESAEKLVRHPGKPPENDRAFIEAIPYARYFYWPFPSDEAFAAARSEFAGVWNGQLAVEDVCRKVSYDITKSVENFMLIHPEAHLPVKTKWIPFDERAVSPMEP